MTKQSDSGGTSLPRNESVVPSLISGPAGSSNSKQPIQPDSPPTGKLRTVSPITRRVNPTPQPKPAVTADPNAVDAGQPQPKIKRRWKPVPDLFAKIGPSARPVDDELVRAGIKANPDFVETTITVRDRIEKNRHPLSSFLISTSVHLIAFLLLAILMLELDRPTPAISLVAMIDSTPTPEKPADINIEAIPIEIPNENDSPIDRMFKDTSNDANLNAAEANATAPSVVKIDSEPKPADTLIKPSKTGLIPTGGGLEGRVGASRAALASRMGGTRESEMAVELGLKWIVAHQRADGSWHFLHDDGNCHGECGNQGTQEATTGATGLALMALLGAGYTHKTGQYQEEVQKGLNYLIDKMQVTGRGGNLTSGKSKMYAHAMATIALSEAWAMTKDTNLIGPVEEARKYIQTVQHKAGGWRYNPGELGDLSVTGWQLMALKSCEISGFNTGKVTFELAEDFVDSMAASSRGFGYQKPEENPTMTAVGVLSKMYLNAELNHERLEDSTQMLVEIGPSKNDMYYNYYATQVLHHRRDDGWPKWNQVQRDYLIQTQDKSDSHQAGSWYFPDQHGQVGGRLYTTTMAVMILEVYYRYMPLYNEEAVKIKNGARRN